ncbi:MAG TPA: YsnF/AvaK domain-containing protein [Thermomicrobiales bacterium]
MSGTNRRDDETRGIEAPGPLDRALDRDRNDRADILESGAERTTAHGTSGTRQVGEAVAGHAGGDVRIPVAEERLSVGKREVDLGEVDVRKTVTEEEQTIPVTLRREEARVREVSVDERPLREDDDAFNEGTIRMQLRGEEAVVSKDAVVTGEVVIDKETVTEERQVGGTVRKQHIDVDQAYQQVRGDFERTHATTGGATSRTFAQAEPHYRSGFTAAHDERYANREFEDIEPDLRREYETRSATHTGGTATSGGDNWEQLRHEVREGWNRARNR